MIDTIERELWLPASLAHVWHAITNSTLLESWLADEVAFELHPGGEASFRFGDRMRSGWVEEVSAPGGGDGDDFSTGRLAFWWANGDEPATRVELTLTPAREGGTLLRVVECRPLQILDLVGIPLRGSGGASYGPALVAAAR